MVDYVVSGLVKRRAELAGEIEHLHDHLRKLLADRTHPVKLSITRNFRSDYSAQGDVSEAR